MNEKGSSHQLLKRNNYHLIKMCIYQSSPISRVEVAQKLSLTTPALTKRMGQWNWKDSQETAGMPTLYCSMSRPTLSTSLPGASRLSK